MTSRISAVRCGSHWAQRMDQRQRRFAFGQVVAEVLAAGGRVGAVVEHVVDQLVGGAEVPAEARQRALHRLRGAADHRGDLGAGLEQLRGLAVDHLEIARSVVSGSWAFISCSTSPSAITLVASAMISITRCERVAAISWKAREYTKSPTSTLAWLPTDLVGGVAAAARADMSTTSSCSRVAVWMNSMNGGGLDAARAGVAGAAGEHHQQRAQALAAAANDVLGDLVHQRYAHCESRCGWPRPRPSIGANQGADSLERLRTAAVINSQLFVSPRECGV
jgi:hypothetical protein